MKCPYCAETIQDEAIKCKHCGEWLQQRESLNSHIPIGEYAKRSLDNVMSAYKSVFGESKFPPPTDASPFEINDELSIGKTYFLWKGHKFDYAGVESFAYLNNHLSINLLLHIYNAFIDIRHKDIKNSIGVGVNKIMVQGKLTKRIIFAIPHIAINTFYPRLEFYLNKIKMDFRLTIRDRNKNDVALFANGMIRQKNTTLSLVKIFENNTFLFGMQSAVYGGYQEIKIEPNRIVLAYEEKALRPFFLACALSDGPGILLTSLPRIDFSPVSDFDVICALLKFLGSENAASTNL